MIKKLTIIFLLCCTLVISLAACRSTSLDARHNAVPTSLAANPTGVSNTPTKVTLLDGLLTADACLNHTHGEAECKDCCDCLETDSAGRKACRDACPKHDFSQNTDYITIDVISILGPDGDYSAYTSAGSQGACKDRCDSSTTLQSGDRRYCRDACNQMPDSGNSDQNLPDNNQRLAR
jgi:hypothetical protein